MLSRSQQRQGHKDENILGIGVSLSIILGVFLQVGDNIYMPNVIIKNFGILLPITIALCILVVRDKNFKLGLSKRFITWLFIAVLYVIYLVVETSNFGRLFLGTADRNLGLISWGLAALSFIAGVALTPSQRYRVLLVVTLTAAVQSLIVGYQKFLKSDVPNGAGGFDPPAFSGTFYNSNPLSFFLGVISSGLLAYIFFSKWRDRQTWAFGILLTFSLLGLYWSASSQGIIGLMAIAALFTSQKVIPLLQRNFGAVLVFSYTTALVVFVSVTSRIPLSPDSNVSVNPFLERLEIYKVALLMSYENIWRGVGLDRFASDYGKYTSTADLKLVDNAHSIPLQVVSTQGLVGLFFFLSIIVWVFSFKPDNSFYSKSEWSFWQAIFFSSALIGIIGIEHPVVTLITFLAGGILRSMRLTKISTKSKPMVLLSSRVFYAFTAAFSITLISSLLLFTQSELRVANKLKQLSERTLSAPEFDLNVNSEYKDIYNARLLLTTGQAYIAIENRLGAENVARLMLSRFPDDQRTSILFFAIADKWVDEAALKVAIELRDKLFPTVKNGDSSSP